MSPVTDRSSIPDWSKEVAIKINNYYELGLKDSQLRELAWLIQRASAKAAPTAAEAELRAALQTSFVAMKLANALPSVNAEYDFGPAIASAEHALR